VFVQKVDHLKDAGKAGSLFSKILQFNPFYLFEITENLSQFLFII